MEDENFKKDLEDLFKLFNRLVEQESLEDVPGVDPQQIEQLKQFVSQFNEIKDSLRMEQIHVDPFSRMMVSALVKQLREQLGPDPEEHQALTAEDIVNQREEELKALSDEKQRDVSIIETIDEQLKNPNLTDEEIDALLDRRSQISSNLSRV